MPHALSSVWGLRAKTSRTHVWKGASPLVPPPFYDGSLGPSAQYIRWWYNPDIINPYRVLSIPQHRTQKCHDDCGKHMNSSMIIMIDNAIAITANVQYQRHDRIMTMTIIIIMDLTAIEEVLPKQPYRRLLVLAWLRMQWWCSGSNLGLRVCKEAVCKKMNRKEAMVSICISSLQRRASQWRKWNLRCCPRQAFSTRFRVENGIWCGGIFFYGRPYYIML